MRLSLTKAAHVTVDGNRVQEIRVAPAYVGRKRFVSIASPVLPRILINPVKALEGLRPIFFGPRTLVRTWATRPNFIRALSLECVGQLLQ
jgi:hypothetical protein